MVPVYLVVRENNGRGGGGKNGIYEPKLNSASVFGNHTRVGNNKRGGGVKDDTGGARSTFTK